MKPTYPNLKLIEFKAQQILNRMGMGEDNPQLDFSLIMFPQVWDGTCTGFDIMPNGKPVFNSSAITKEYTTVVRISPFDVYCVFFGNKMAYACSKPNKNFLNDLKEQNMASISRSKWRYID